jgi:hypothetical protein
MSLLASVVWSRSGVRRRDDWTETCRAAVDGLGRRTASGYAGNWDDGPRNRTEAETHADRRVRPNAPPEEKDIGTAALRLIRDDCQAGSVRVPDCAGRPFMRSSSLLKKVFRGGRRATLIQEPSLKRMKDSRRGHFWLDCCSRSYPSRVFQQTASSVVGHFSDVTRGRIDVC